MCKYCGMIRRLLWRLLWVAVTLVILGALPVLWVETQCVTAAPAPPPTAAAFVSRLEAADRRAATGTYYTFPEWAIVYAYQDLARVTRASSESDFNYIGAVATYWNGLCKVTTAATQRAPSSFSDRTVSHIIGLSFTAEMLLKSAYEGSLGRIASYLRGAAPVAEDIIARDVADDYASFLELKPWYEYRFDQKVDVLWAIPYSGTLRGADRRLGLTVEWWGKSIYASVMRAAAGSAMPFSTRIRSVIPGLTDEDIAAVPGITKVAALPDGAVIIETDRYRALTTALLHLAQRGRNFSEIAGNDRVMISVLATGPNIAVPAGSVTTIVQTIVQGRPNVVRAVMEVPVARLAEVMRALSGSSTEFELVYDFY
jgi:hypothetical protein